MNSHGRKGGALAVMVVVALASVAGQARRPVAEVAATVETKAPRPGATVRLIAHVRLPAGVHVQSNKPRDPDLIPTVLSVTPPKGAALVDVVYPKASDLTLPGYKEPLAVYPNEFDIVVRVKLDAGAQAGALAVPATLRYQACNDSVCFAPARATVSWTLQVAKG